MVALIFCTLSTTPAEVTYINRAHENLCFGHVKNKMKQSEIASKSWTQRNFGNRLYSVDKRSLIMQQDVHRTT